MITLLYCLFVNNGYTATIDPIMWLLMLHALSDGMIGVAFILISFCLGYLGIKRKGDIFWVFCVFIFLGGVVHALNVLDISLHIPSLITALKLITGITTLFSAVYLINITPQILSLPKAGEIEALNRDLLERKEQLQGLNIDLEAIVQERTKSLQEANEELSRSNEELTQFAYIASHDLREPLRNIIVFTQLLQRRHISNLNVEAQEYMKFAVDSANRMQLLVNSLLMYSRVDHNKLRYSKFNLNAPIQQALGDLKLAIENENAIIKTSNLPCIIGDQQQLSIVFQNLISNALRYKSEKVPEIEIQATADQHFITVYIKDNGIGFDIRYKDRLFKMFQRLDNSSMNDQGTGMGLAICKKIIQQHGGKIDVSSAPGLGTIFTFTLPHKQSNG